MQIRNLPEYRIHLSIGALFSLAALLLHDAPFYQHSFVAHTIAGILLGCSIPLIIYSIILRKRSKLA